MTRWYVAPNGHQENGPSWGSHQDRGHPRADDLEALMHLHPWQVRILREIQRANREGRRIEFHFSRRMGLSTIRQALQAMEAPRSRPPATRSDDHHAR